MCFYNDDFDWYAEVCRTVEGTDGRATRCIECGAKIAAGEWRRHLEQIEHECCQICEDDCSEIHDPDQDPAAVCNADLTIFVGIKGAMVFTPGSSRAASRVRVMRFTRELVNAI